MPPRPEAPRPGETRISKTERQELLANLLDGRAATVDRVLHPRGRDIEDIVDLLVMKTRYDSGGLTMNQDGHLRRLMVLEASKIDTAAVELGPVRDFLLEVGEVVMQDKVEYDSYHGKKPRMTLRWRLAQEDWEKYKTAAEQREAG